MGVIMQLIPSFFFLTIPFLQVRQRPVGDWCSGGPLQRRAEARQGPQVVRPRGEDRRHDWRRVGPLLRL